MKEQMKQIIKAYLDDRATNDELFAVAYAKEKKSLDECIAYIFQEAQTNHRSDVCQLRTISYCF